MDNRYQAYRQVDINTTNRGKIVVMLYSGAITFLNKAKLYMEKNDFVNKGKYIIKAQNIIDELNYSLDMEKGQDISKNLRSIYTFLNRYLSQANVQCKPEMLDKAIHILDRFKTAFEEIVNNPELSEAQDIKKKEQITHAIRKLV
ncbi:MAG TPA: flagellar export chaperone FliS [Candidatus Cloacimonadota bacterium]|jgi:flagellar protein FliS|nr:flagellar export chaperone FliS [Candidatus Cloacimonadota bacterium]HOD53702.1 flagellar export chaperone FliS [Candidatus Cloacimonadota bacterium]HPM00947.1 flagellar export chaperone FliS [Candidatus Cloacimonadota bacterium]